MRSVVASAAAALVVSGCAHVFAPAPVGAPSGREGWLVYRLRDLRFEAPAAWRAAGGDRRMSFEAPDGRARLELSYPETDLGGEKACLATAEEKLRGQQVSLERAQRHGWLFAGRPAQKLEGDERGWHVWAFAACDRGVQYRVFFTAATPARPEVIEVWHTLVRSARIGGEA